MPTRLIAKVRSLQRLAAEQRRARAPSTEPPPSLLDFIPWASPGWLRPDHLAGFASSIERAFVEPLETYATLPPRHAKSETVMHGIAWGLRRYPRTPVLYATHTATFANKQSKRIKQLARLAGVDIEQGSNRADEWETTAGGGLVARGVGGEVTGRGFKVIVVDDPFKGREYAESPRYRDKVYDWLTDDIFTRGTPDAAILIIHTRWHPDDPIGRLEKEGWSGTVLRCLAEEDDPLGRPLGAPLWPELWPLEALDKRRRLVGEYAWAALFQGRPRPRGGKVFGPPTFYRELPAFSQRAYGVDLAYTASTQADRSVCVEMLREDRRVPPKEKKPLPQYYLKDVISKQEPLPRFSLRLKVAQNKAPAPMLFIGSGTEKFAAEFVTARVPRFEIQSAIGDKFVRAQEFAADWNDGRVLLPDPEVFPCEWLPDFLDVLDRFTGQDDPRDDEVDAAVAAHRKLRRAKRRGFGAYT